MISWSQLFGTYDWLHLYFSTSWENEINSLFPNSQHNGEASSVLWYRSFLLMIHNYKEILQSLTDKKLWNDCIWKDKNFTEECQKPFFCELCLVCNTSSNTVDRSLLQKSEGSWKPIDFAFSKNLPD